MGPVSRACDVVGRCEALLWRRWLFVSSKRTVCVMSTYLEELEASGCFGRQGGGRREAAVECSCYTFCILDPRFRIVNLSPRQYINNFYPRAVSQRCLGSKGKGPRLCHPRGLGWNAGTATSSLHGTLNNSWSLSGTHSLHL